MLARERVNVFPLCRCVVDEIFVSQESGHRSGVQDRRSGLHMLDASLGDIEIAVQVRLHGVIDVLLGQLLDPAQINTFARPLRLSTHSAFALAVGAASLMIR